MALKERPILGMHIEKNIAAGGLEKFKDHPGEHFIWRGAVNIFSSLVPGNKTFVVILITTI